MTLIACTSNFKKPFLIGDLLITSNSVDKSIQLPTNAIDINKYLQPKHTYAIGLLQKIYIVKSNVCVALAGDVYEMTEFLKEFTNRCSYFDIITEKEIRAFIKDYDILQLFANSAFFIMLMSSEGNQIVAQEFCYPAEKWNSVQSDLFEEAFACGSGRDDFLYQISEKPYSSDATFEKGNIYRAIALNHGLIAKLLATERISLHTLNKNWGGGFETICFDGNKFIKVDQVAYITSYAEFDADGNTGLPFPQLIIYYEYYKDVLFMSSIEIQKWSVQESEENLILISSQYKANMHIAPRIDLPKGSTIEPPPAFSFQTQRISFGYTFVYAKGFLAPAYFSEGIDATVEYKNNEFVKLIMNKQIVEKICNGAKDVFPNL